MYYYNHYHQQPYQQTAYNPSHTSHPVNTNYLYHTVQRDPYPPVDSTQFHESAKHSQTMMKDANLLIGQFATSKDFCTKVMDAAQRNQQDEVQRLFHSIGVTSKVDVAFNPDELRLEFSSNPNVQNCCRLLIVLRWR